MLFLTLFCERGKLASGVQKLETTLFTFSGTSLNGLCTRCSCSSRAKWIFHTLSSGSFVFQQHYKPKFLLKLDEPHSVSYLLFMTLTEKIRLNPSFCHASLLWKGHWPSPDVVRKTNSCLGSPNIFRYLSSSPEKIKDKSCNADTTHVCTCHLYEKWK